ncbi:MAG: ATP-dependent Clp protease proteolytic subunit, partial [Terracidiphilus sp.]
MKSKHPYFRLNPSRSVQVVGKIDRDLLARVTPQILKLQAQSREPITVYIDSNGGSVAAAETLLSLLRVSDQDSSDPCHIITVVTTKAASAAADLLSSGDYAVAFPYSAVLYHGLRTEEQNAITAEYSSWLAFYLRRSNDRYALELAKKIDDRFTFRFVFAHNEFDEIRKQPGKQTLSDVDCFVEFIDGKLSAEAKKIWQRAKKRQDRYSELFD